MCVTCIYLHTYTLTCKRTHYHHLTGHQAAKWGVKYNFHACWQLLIKHFPLQLPSASYSLAFDTPFPSPPLKGLPLHRKGSGLSIRASSDLCLTGSVVFYSPPPPPSESTKEPAAQTSTGRTWLPYCSSDLPGLGGGWGGQPLFPLPLPTEPFNSHCDSCGYRQWVPVLPHWASASDGGRDSGPSMGGLEGAGGWKALDNQSLPSSLGHGLARPPHLATET